ncbi:MAG: hypothetical protein ACRC8A_20885 [Microcoleaceae cyanobacterium]
MSGLGLLLTLAQPLLAEVPALCVINESETNDLSFQLFDCSYSRSQIQSERVGFQLDTNSGVLIILSTRPGAEVVMPDPEQVSNRIVTPWIVKRTSQVNDKVKLTIYNQQTQKTVTIDLSF